MTDVQSDAAVSAAPAVMTRIQVRLGELGLAKENLRFNEPADEGVPQLAETILAAGVANSGNVADGSWEAAQQAGWNDEQLADAFAYLGATVFTAYFLNYAQTELDI